MLTRVFLAAGAAALAIAAPAYAGPGGHGGDGGGNPHQGGGGGGGGGPHGGGGGGGPHGGGGGGNPHGSGGGPPAFAGGGGGGHGGGGGPHGGGSAPAFIGGGGGGRGHGGGGPFMSFGGGPRGHGGGAPAFSGGGRGHGGGRPAFAGGGGHGHGGGFAHQQGRAFAGGSGHGHGYARHQGHAFAGGGGHGHGGGFAHQQGRAFAGGGGHGHGGGFARQQGQTLAGNGNGHGHAFAQQQARGGMARQGMIANGQQLRGNQMQGPALANQQQFGVQQLGSYGARGGANFVANGQYAQSFAASPYSALTYGNNVQVLPVEQVQTFVGVPVAQVASFGPISPIPADLAYLYPPTPNYYYEWGDGYLYQVDRTDNLIAALIPLLAGGYLPGQYLPGAYMTSYVPAYYGFDSFYPDYGGLCNRYYDGVIYQVDCGDGYVENVVPMYAGGYGVGQLLPAAYSTYNVPVQYRSMYYDSPDAGYWYSPGAIYQYDPHTSVITSVAALMAPGFTVGQPLPVGYDVYNVPLPYRATYYDTPSAWYRYNNGYIYQIDPATQLVTAIVASLLT